MLKRVLLYALVCPMMLLCVLSAAAYCLYIAMSLHYLSRAISRCALCVHVSLPLSLTSLWFAFARPASSSRASLLTKRLSECLSLSLLPLHEHNVLYLQYTHHNVPTAAGARRWEKKRITPLTRGMQIEFFTLILIAREHSRRPLSHPAPLFAARQKATPQRSPALSLPTSLPLYLRLFLFAFCIRAASLPFFCPLISSMRL